MVKHAWYSKKQFECYLNDKAMKFKEFVWLDENNEEVHCTEVTNEKKSYWDDAVYLGLVYKYESSIMKSKPFPE